MRAARGVTHSDARQSMYAHHEEHMQELFAREGQHGELTAEQAEYLLRFARIHRNADDTTGNSGSINKQYMRTCAPGTSALVESESKPDDACECGDKRLLDAREQLLVCPSCGSCVQDHCILMPQHSTEESSIMPHFTYKKVNHFREWLAQCQAREMSNLEPVVAAVRAELKKQRVSEEEQQKLTPAKVRQLLRSLRLGCYDHTHRIHSSLTGRSPPQFDHETEMRLVELFKATLAPFEAVRQKICPERSNFLSYSYVLRKLTSLIGIKCSEEHDLYFPLLKSREKLYAADRMWRAICAELNWPFERSM
jgi:hypothetical protein